MSPQRKVVEAFRAAGGAGKPCYGELTVCWAQVERDAHRTAREYWPISAMASDGFLRFYQREILPQVRDLRAAA